MGLSDPSREIRVAFLAPDSRPGMTPKQRRTERHPSDRRCGTEILYRIGGMEFDAAQMFGADEAVLVRAHQTGRRAVVAIERRTVETFGDEHVVSQRVLDRHDRPVPVKTAEGKMSDGRVGPKGSLDDQPIEGFE